MKNRTIKVILILVSMLFLNIEAAQAGLVHKLRLYIRQEFPDQQFFLLAGFFLLAASVSYVIFAPVLINKQKWSWLNYYTYHPAKPDYRSKRVSIKKISDILQAAEFSKQAHS